MHFLTCENFFLPLVFQSSIIFKTLNAMSFIIFYLLNSGSFSVMINRKYKLQRTKLIYQLLVNIQHSPHPAFHWLAKNYSTLYLHSCSCQCAKKRLRRVYHMLTRKQKRKTNTRARNEYTNSPIYSGVYSGLYLLNLGV